MATLSAAQAASDFPALSFYGRGVLNVAYGTYTLAANPTQDDVIQFCKVPKGCTVIGGWVQAKDIDTGTEALDIDIGFAANGVDEADPDAFGNFGVWTGDAITDLKPEAGVYFPLGGILFTAGPKTFTVETMIQGDVNAAANAGGTGQITVVVLYVMP